MTNVSFRVMGLALTFGETLKIARTRAGFTQDALADALGVSRPLLSAWESGRSTPGLAQLARFANATRAPWLWTEAAHTFGAGDLDAVERDAVDADAGPDSSPC